jgi:hypothetical protein
VEVTSPVAVQSISDEHYVIDLCDRALGLKSLRQHTFDFLRGDPGKNGVGRQLPVDAYYHDLNLVIEYRERQHFESVKFFDQKKTVSRMSRGQQRALYDQRRRDVLPQHGIALVEFDFDQFRHKSNRRLVRDEAVDLEVVRAHLRHSIGTFRNGHEIAPKRGPSVTAAQLNQRNREHWEFATQYAQSQVDSAVQKRAALEQARRAKGTAKMLETRNRKKPKIDERNALIRAASDTDKKVKEISNDRNIFSKAAKTKRAQKAREKLIYRVISSTSSS